MTVACYSNFLYFTKHRNLSHFFNSNNPENRRLPQNNISLPAVRERRGTGAGFRKIAEMSPALFSSFRQSFCANHQYLVVNSSVLEIDICKRET